MTRTGALGLGTAPRIFDVAALSSQRRHGRIVHHPMYEPHHCTQCQQYAPPNADCPMTQQPSGWCKPALITPKSRFAIERVLGCAFGA